MLESAELPTFDDVKDVRVKAYNRLITFINTSADAGTKVAKEYLSGIDNVGKQEVLRLKGEILKHGFEAVKQTIIRDHRVFEERATPV